ncbi:pyruvate formate lyase activating enzyme, partial [Candidatus Hakubella thermalkaliphila]
MDLRSKIRSIPDFPKKGIVFRDITPLLLDKDAFRYAVDQIVEHYKDRQVTSIFGAEARGFIFGAAVA